MEKLNIITRREWKALKPKQPYIPIFPDRILIHHYGFDVGCPRAFSSNYYRGHTTIKNLQIKHVRKFGLNDIKYHFIITRDGIIYEGRPMNVAGCHCDNYDNKSIAIMFFGNYNVEDVPREQLKSFMLLLKHIKSNYPHLKIPQCLNNHRDFEHTLCPGHHLSNLINIIKLRQWNL